MTNCLFYSLFFALFLNVSFGSLRMSQINRSFLSIYKGMLEASVITIDGSGEPVLPYYNKERVNEFVSNYLDKNISKFVKNYEITTTFTERNSTEICNSYCRELRLRLKAKINALYKYEKEQVFTVYEENEV